MPTRCTACPAQHFVQWCATTRGIVWDVEKISDAWLWGQAGDIFVILFLLILADFDCFLALISSPLRIHQWVLGCANHLQSWFEATPFQWKKSMKKYWLSQKLHYFLWGVFSGGISSISTKEIPLWETTQIWSFSKRCNFWKNQFFSKFGFFLKFLI